MTRADRLEVTYRALRSAHLPSKACGHKLVLERAKELRAYNRTKVEPAQRQMNQLQMELQ